MNTWQKILLPLMALLQPRIERKAVGNYAKAKPSKEKKAKKRNASVATNHQRVVAGRAARMGITVEEYKDKYGKK